MLNISAPPKFIDSIKPCRRCGGHLRYASSPGSCVDCVRKAAAKRITEARRREFIGLPMPECFVERWAERQKKPVPAPNALPWIAMDRLMARR